MNKNPTPRSIAFYTALAVTFFVGLFVYISGLNIIAIGSILAFTFATTFILFIYAIEVFIYRKIKLVYKNIHNLKLKKVGPRFPEFQSSDPITDVENEVRNWAEAKFTEIEQLREMEQYRKEFLGNVSHELKTPIFNIQGYINTLLDGAIDDPVVAVPFLKKADKSTDRIATLVDELEAITQLESGFLTMEMEPFDIHELIHDIFDSLASRAAKRNITLKFKDGCDVPFMVEADKDRIRQVVINLIVNSIKYGNDDGTTQVGIYDMDKNALIDVADDGIGIAEEHIPRLFERFYRVDKSRSREGGGTGLGLSIVKHIIEAHNQTINARSTMNVGTTLSFTLKKP